MGYCGCGTKANKGRWGLVCIFLVLAMIFLGVYIGVSSKCKICRNEGGVRVCDDDFGADFDRDGADLEGCSEGAVVATFFLFIISLIAATVPCCCMCCCARGPQANQYQHDIAIVGKPGEPAAQAYQHDPYAQPGYAQPAYAQPAYGQPVQAGQQQATI
eukprot:jgi/Ulvmu1/3629/UM017_0041.1